MSSYIRDNRLAQGQSGDHGKQERRAWRPAFRLFGGHLGDRLSLGFNAAVALFTLISAVEEVGKVGLKL